jgi:predicted phage terminase large subunit-like protein
MTITPNREEFDALTRVDFNVFVERVFAELNGAEPYLDNYHVGAICAELEAARRGEILRLAIALPPRSLKSIIISVAYPAWLLGHNPEAKIICASYGAQLAEELARDCRQVMRSDWYRRLFPGTRLKSDRQSIASFESTAGGSRISTSVGGVLTGFGADVIIVDDPTKPEEALSEVERAKANHWLSHTLLTRLNDKTKGLIILVMQRLHEDDMIGYFVRLTEAKLVSFPAIAQEHEAHEWQTPFGTRRHSRPEGEVLHAAREPLAALEQLRVAMGARMFAAQYLQMPAPPGGSIVKPEWFPRYDLSKPPEFDTVFQSWDTASKATELSDFSVCTTWGKKDGRLYLINVLRKRLEYPDLKRAVIDQARFFNAKKVLIEDASSGQALIQDLHNDGFWLCEAVKANRDKVMRLRSVTSPIEAGLVFVPERAPWLEDYFHELMMFPASRYDDQVDSSSQALTNAFIFRSSGDGWWEYIQQELREKREGPIPCVRVNCENKGVQFQLITGRTPVRDANGSFLMTKEEARYMPASCYRVDEDGVTPLAAP